MIGILAAIGIALRLRQFVFNRALWHDEVLLALDVLRHDFLELIQPFDSSQTAPVGFLWLQKLMVTVLGNSDVVFRIVPLAAGLASIFLLVRLLQGAEQTSVDLPDLLTAAFFVLSSELIRYSTEAKQYSSDVLVTTGLLVLTRSCLLQGQFSPRALARFAFLGAVALFLSHSTVFILVGTGVALGLKLLADKRWRMLLPFLAAIGVQVAALGILYKIVLQSQASTDFLLAYWNDRFAPWPPWNDPKWHQSTFHHQVLGMAGLAPAYLAEILLALGLFRILRTRWYLFAGITAGALAILTASGLRLYPLAGRLLLFTAPILYLVIGEGLRSIQGTLLPLNRTAAVAATLALAAVLLASPATLALQGLRQPITREEIKPVLRYLSENRSHGERIYVYVRAIPNYTYYAPFYGLPGGDFIAGRAQGEAALEDFGRLAGTTPVWLVFTDNCPTCRQDERAILRLANKRGIRLDLIRAPGAAAFLYEIPEALEPEEH